MVYANYETWRPGIDVGYNSPVFKRAVFEHLGWIYSKPMGKTILDFVLAYKNSHRPSHRERVSFPHSPLRIEEGTGVGYGDYVTRDSIDYHVSREYLDPTYGSVIDARARPVYLYHELVHAYRATLGHYLRSTLDEGNPDEEYPTTGLFEYADTRFSENSFRRSLRLPRRPSYFMEGEFQPNGKELETKRRYFLMLPIGRYNPREKEFTPPNHFTRQININQFRTYAARHYAFEKRRWPDGFPDDLRPDDAARQYGHGPPLDPRFAYLVPSTGGVSRSE